MSANFRPAAEPAATFRFGEFTFDCGSHRLMSSGVERHLSPKARQLLHILLLARPHALAREALYDALWPSTFVCETNLASIISEVRRALGDDARVSHYIRTVHTFGYAFCGEVMSTAPMPFREATLQYGKRSHQMCEGDNLVGRSQDCHVVITEATISRRHAMITISEGTSSIRDLDSSNGTYVDGQRIGSSAVLLAPGSRIEFGAVVASIIFRKIPSTRPLSLNMSEIKNLVADGPTSDLAPGIDSGIARHPRLSG